MTQTVLHTGLGLLFVAALLAAVVWDIVTFEIPDTISVILAATALIGLLAAGFGTHGGAAREVLWGLLTHLLVGGVLFVAGVVLFSLGQWGGGDVKLLGATGLWFSWNDLPFYLSAVALTGGVLTLGILGIRRLPWPERWRQVAWFARLLRPDQGVPYGVALGIGGILSFNRALATGI